MPGKNMQTDTLQQLHISTFINVKFVLHKICLQTVLLGHMTLL